MNDKELLELAAKAAGHDVRRELMDNGEPFFIGQSKEHAWNPLTDDGDALRLAAKLGMDVCLRPFVAYVYADMPNQDVMTDACYRRAIVRAAAEIGRSMA